MKTKKRLTWPELIVVASTLFGMFFGAGNIIFPVLMGQMAGANSWQAAFGFAVTAVGLPLLAIVAMGLSHSDGVIEMSRKVSKGYSYFFTIAIYLTIGPFFAIPRTATVSYEIGFASLVPQGQGEIFLFIYSLIFFLMALYFALRPSGILDWVGKYLNPAFLVILAVILIRAFLAPEISVADVPAVGAYETAPIAEGLLQGYNTMDGLAALAFGIIVIRSIRSIGVTEPQSLARETVKSGALSLTFMVLIYLGLTILGTQSIGFTGIAPNGGLALAEITHYYFGPLGQILLAAMMLVACLKTAIGLIIALAETFTELIPGRMGLRSWTLVATLVSFLVANIGLESIISLSIPVLMLLYPLAITLILMHLLEPIVKSREIYVTVTIFTFIAAVFDMLKAAPEFIYNLLNGDFFIQIAEQYLPLFDIGFGWIVPATIGLVIGLILTFMRGSNESTARKIV